jgi:hypothetical protein
MHVDQHVDEHEYGLTAEGRGQFHEIDPRTGREPAGSGLLARAAAVRQAQESALKKAVANLAAMSTAGWARAGDKRAAAFVEREIVPRIFDLIERRVVLSESRDDKFYFVRLGVIFDTSALTKALDKFNR